MKTIAPSIIIATLAIVFSGCAWRHAPGFSIRDNSYFMELPHIAQKGDDYFLCWRYGSMGFYFFPESRVRDGKLVFSLQATSSSGSLSGRLGEVKIEGKSKIHALEVGGAFWWEPDGQMIQLKIVNELSNHALHRTAARRFSFRVPNFWEAEFAGSARFRRRSVS